MPVTVKGAVEASPYNPQPADIERRSLITCTAVTEAADGIKTFHFGHPESSPGHSAAVSYTPGQFTSFDIQVCQPSISAMGLCLIICSCRRQASHLSQGQDEANMCRWAHCGTYTAGKSLTDSDTMCRPWDLASAAWILLMRARSFLQDPSDASKVLNRTWTISSHPSEATASSAFSITVKRVGLVSGWLHSKFGPGSVLQWLGVGGEFMPQQHAGPALLVAGGIGGELSPCLYL